VRALLREQRLRAFVDLPLDRFGGHARGIGLLGRRRALFEDVIYHDCRDCVAMMSAARLPERIAPSMVAGRPVSVQSPANKRLRHLVVTPGRMASWARVGAQVARRSRTICQGGSAAGNPVKPAPSPQIFFASSSRGASMSRSPALMVTESRPGNANSHCTVALSTPRIGGCAAGGSMRKCALTMARNSVGTVRSRSKDDAI